MGDTGKVLSYVPVVGPTIGGMFGYDPNQEAMENAANLNRQNIEQQQAWWKANAYPSADAVESMKRSSLADMNQNMQLAQRNFLESSAARGLRGGGAVSTGLSDIERQRQQSYGKLLNQLAIYANTPQFNPSYAGNVTGGYNSANSSNPLNSMLGTMGGMAGGLYGYNLLAGAGGLGAGAGAGTAGTLAGSTGLEELAALGLL